MTTQTNFNTRKPTWKGLGVVTDKYQVVQNHEAFAFTEELLGHGVRYETAGMLQEGGQVYGCTSWCEGRRSWENSCKKGSGKGKSKPYMSNNHY